MANLDDQLYRWIVVTNKRREALDLPVGLIEDSIGVLKAVLGSDYLESLVMQEKPVHFLDDDVNPLRKWLLSPTVDQYVIQTLEVAKYLQVFRNDPSLPDKVQKLKYDNFWAMFFELAMAARVKRASRTPEKITLSAEVADSVGDFNIGAHGYSIPCECSRLGQSPQITDPKALQERLTYRISEGTKRVDVPVCVKIRSDEELNGNTYNAALRLIRRCIGDARQQKLPCEYTSGSTTAQFETLCEASEPIPFRAVDGKIVDVGDTDWDTATSVCRVPAANSVEVADRFEEGERFHQYEAVRLFMKFGQPHSTNHYERLSAKLKKKINQTKISHEHFGKVIFVEVTFDLRLVDGEELSKAVRQAVGQSRTTLAVVLAKREPNPHFRYHYCLCITFNQTGASLKPEVAEHFERLAKAEIGIDPILESAYQRTWEAAKKRAYEISKPIPE